MPRTPLLAWLGLTLLFATGCSSLHLLGPKVYEADAKHPVGEILCIWEPAEGRGTDNHPCRGFGGQILFFAAGRKAPVKVHGDVRIYVFDEQGVNGDPALPIHQFDFPAAAWNALLRPSNLGTSYQIFVPYTRKGQHQATCSVRVSLTPDGGLPIYSKTATVELPGTASVVKTADKQIVTASQVATPADKPGIVTADWSDLLHNPESAFRSGASATPGMALATHHQASRQAHSLQALRQAAEEANQAASAETPRELPATATSRKLNPLHPLPSASEPGEPPVDMPETADSDAAAHDSSAADPANRPLPGAESDSE